MSDTDREWIEQRITATKAMIVAIEGAILALAGGALTYTLDTGQTKQSVTKADLNSLRLQLETLEARLSSLTSQLCGGGTVYVRPAW